MQGKVFVWSAFRSGSNAFERSLRNLDQAKVFHTPYERAYFLSEDRKSTKFQDRQPNPNYNYKSVSSDLQQEYSGMKFVLIKDHPSFVYPDFEMFLADGFKGFKHTFLIRNPRRSMHSMKRLLDKFGLDFDYKEHATFPPLVSLYEFIKEHVDPNPVVVDVDDVLEYPEEMMFSFCKAVGIDYKAGMTRWEPGAVEDWETFPELCSGWHDDVVKSSGFFKPQERDLTVKLPDEMENVIKESMAGYESMYRNRIRPDKFRGLDFVNTL